VPFNVATASANNTAQLSMEGLHNWVFMVESF
jgi:hypothetical protein